jgi:hypothetical protein
VVRFLAGAKGRRAHEASYSMGSGGSFSRKTRPGCETKHSLLHIADDRNE